MDFENKDRHSDILLDVAVEEIIQGQQKGYALAEDRRGVCNAAARTRIFYYIIQVRVRGCTTLPHPQSLSQSLGTRLIQV